MTFTITRIGEPDNFGRRTYAMEWEAWNGTRAQVFRQDPCVGVERAVRRGDEVHVAPDAYEAGAS